MHGTSRLASIEGRLGAAALVVGRVVRRGVGVLPRLVRRASGIDPSPEATIAGVVRGITTLAPKAMGGLYGPCLELAGAATVLALATWAVRAESDGDGVALADAIGYAERRGLCSTRTASLWRATVGLAPIDRDLLCHEAILLSVSALHTLSHEGLWRTLGRTMKGVRRLHVGLAFVDAWQAMGEAARLVESTKRFAAERRMAQRSDAVVIRFFPSRAA